MCPVLKDRSHVKTQFIGYKLRGRKGGSVCHAVDQCLT